MGKFKSKSFGGTHRKTQSAQSPKLVFNDRDQHSDSKDTDDDYDAESDDEHEDSVVARYTRMNLDELDDEKQKLMREHREIAWRLWDKYIRVGAEYEINIDYGERKKFAWLMRNKDVWLD